MPDDSLLDRLAESYQAEPLLADTLQAIQTRPLSMMGGGQVAERREPAALAQVAGARLADPDGPSVAVFDIGGFDTHSAQGGDTGEHANQLRDFDQVLKVLHQSLGPALDQDADRIADRIWPHHESEWRLRHRTWLWHGGAAGWWVAEKGPGADRLAGPRKIKSFLRGAICRPA